MTNRRVESIIIQTMINSDTPALREAGMEMLERCMESRLLVSAEHDWRGERDQICYQYTWQTEPTCLEWAQRKDESSDRKGE